MSGTIEEAEFYEEDASDVLFEAPGQSIVITLYTAQFKAVTLPIATIEALEVTVEEEPGPAPMVPTTFIIRIMMIIAGVSLMASPVAHQWPFALKAAVGAPLALAAAVSTWICVENLARRWRKPRYSHTLTVETTHAGRRDLLVTKDADVFAKVRHALTRAVEEARQNS